MSVPEPRRAAQAAAIAAVGLPCALLAHLLTTGRPAQTPAAALALAALLAVGAALPARSAAGLALVTALGQVAAHSVLAALAVTGAGARPACLPAVGRAASLGLHLTVLRADAGCPAGTLGIAPAATTALTALLTAWMIVAGHAVVAVVAGRLLGRALNARDVLVGLAGLLQRILERTAALLAAPAGAPPPLTTTGPRTGPARLTPVAPVSLWAPGTVSRRGPPAPARPAA